MAELKTQPSPASVKDFLAALPDETRREDSLRLVRLMKQVTGKAPRMWGTSLVGFGTYHYKYARGRQGTLFPIGFASRKADVTLYICTGLERYKPLLKKLGRYKAGKACLHLPSLADVDLAILEELLVTALRDAKKMYTLA